MQSVSQAWKDEQQKKIITAESFVEISLNVGDPDAQADVTASDNGHTDFSNVVQITDETIKEPIKYATLERNIWELDGSCTTLSDNGPYGNNGYIGDTLSGEDGFFTGIIPTITLTFSKVYSSTIPGITITWGDAYGEWASEYRVSAYNGTRKILTELVKNSNMTSSYLADISGYDKITIEILKWSLPYRRARIKELMIGIQQLFTKADFMNYSHEMTVDPLSASLPKAEIKFEVKNLNGEYNPDNPKGSAKYLLERQMITARYGYKFGDNIEWINAGTFFMSEWETPQNGITATFTARDILEYMGDYYSGPSTGTLKEIAEAALNQADLPKLGDGSDRWDLDQSLENISISKESDLSGNSIAEVLQYVANAGCCVFYSDRHGILHIEPLADGATDYEITPFNSYENAEINLTKQLKAVDINNGQHVLTVGTAGDTQTINNPLISDSQAPVVAQWAANYLTKRKTLSGEFRADPRLDALDRVTNENQFSETVVLITEVKYTYNGAFRGSYEAKPET